MAADSLERKIDLADVDRRLNNISLRQQCSSVVCDRLKVRDICPRGTVANGKCLVPYAYGMTLGETYDVAMQSGFAEKLKLQEAGGTRSAAFDEAIETGEAVEKQALPPFRPDWRFWTGVTAAGLGLFLHRSR